MEEIIEKFFRAIFWIIRGIFELIVHVIGETIIDAIGKLCRKIGRRLDRNSRRSDTRY